jgi:peptidoglycan/LPS O-acetylase OafA/YrhL
VKHRTDIDGLRAIAVLPVVAFHVGFPYLKGGFVGVDVFFVISGYLIGSLILKEIGDQRFSFRNFYERRIRRIFPALFAMLALVTLACMAIFPPGNLVDYGRSVVATVFSVANVYFWSQSGYFVNATKPLRHAWSLGIEEQFYVLLPPLLVFLNRYRLDTRRIVIGLIALVSLVWSAYGAFHDRTTTFYLLHTRAWELLLGVFLPLGLFPRFNTSLTRNLAAVVGFGLIAGSMCLLRGFVPFPGLAAIPPCLGAALILRAGETGGSVVGSVLSTPPARFFGLISYSLYLWHWPLIILQSISGITVPGGSEVLTNLAIVLASIALATLSWRFVEQPFRQGRDWLPRRPLFAAAAAASIAAISVGGWLIVSQGLPGRFSPSELRIMSYLGTKLGPSARTGTCFLDDKYGFDRYSKSACLTPSATSKNYLLVGDSHAGALWHGLSVALPGVNVMQANTTGCRPFIRQGRKSPPRCAQVYQLVYGDFLLHHRVDKLVLAGNWQEADLKDLATTLDWIKAHHIDVLLVGPIVQYDGDLPWLLVQENGLEARIAAHRKAGIFRLDKAIRSLAAEKGVDYASLTDAMCDRQGCILLAAPDIPFQLDWGHLTPEGSEVLARRIVQRQHLLEGDQTETD